MTTPPDLSHLIPSKWKAVVGLIGSALSFVVPYLLEATEGLPEPWPVLIGVALFLLTAFGVYRAPYKQPGTVIVDAAAVPAGVPTDESLAPPKQKPAPNYQNPWR